MDSHEKLIMRARLIASGMIRWWRFDKSTEVHDWCEIMAEELVKIDDPDVKRRIRDNLREHGLHVPELDVPSAPDDSDDGLRGQAACDLGDERLEAHSQTFLYTRRANNQVSEYTEAHIRELLCRGLTKSAVARALRVNRRVVIRVVRESQSAQQRQKSHTNDLGTISEGR